MRLCGERARVQRTVTDESRCPEPAPGAAARDAQPKFKGAAEPASPGRSRPAPRGQGALATVGLTSRKLAVAFLELLAGTARARVVAAHAAVGQVRVGGRQ